MAHEAASLIDEEEMIAIGAVAANALASRAIYALQEHGHDGSSLIAEQFFSPAAPGYEAMMRLVRDYVALELDCMAVGMRGRLSMSLN